MRVLFLLFMFSLVVGCSSADKKKIADAGDPPPSTTLDGGDGGTKKVEYAVQTQTELEGSFSTCVQIPVNSITDPSLKSLLADTNQHFPNGAYGKTELSFSGSNLSLKISIYKESTCTNPMLELLSRGRFATGVLSDSAQTKTLDAKLNSFFGTTWSTELVADLNQRQVCDLTNWQVGRAVNLTSLPCEAVILGAFAQIGFTSYKLEDNLYFYLGKNDLRTNPLSNDARPTEYIALPLIRSSSAIAPTDVPGGLIASDQAFWTTRNNALTASLAVTYKKGTALNFTKLTDPTHGNLTLNADGSFSYTSTGTFVGNDTFTFSVTAGDQTREATATILVNRVKYQVADITESAEELERYLNEQALPTGITATPGVLSNTLTWNALPSQSTPLWAEVEKALSYNIYWSTTPGVTKASNKVSKIESGYAHTALTGGVTYYYAVSAVLSVGGENPASIESGLSAEGSGIAKSSNIPERLQLSANSSMLRSTLGNLVGWGNNNSGKLGIGSFFDTSSPTSVDLGSGKTAKSVAFGTSHSCAILNDDSLKCWGHNWQGQLGSPPYYYVLTPTSVDLGGKTVKSVALGIYHTCAILNDDSMKCWGYNGEGQLGIGSTTNATTPQTVNLGSGKTVKSIGLGDYHTCAILNDDSIKCWGYNQSGQLGNNSTSNASTPQPVVLGQAAKSVTLRLAHTCAILNDNSVKCWGWNGHGQLGIGSTTNALTPQPVILGQTAKSIALGNIHTCAILNDDSIKCWGYYGWGQLGTGNFSNTSTPQPVVNLGQTAKSVTLGYFHTCAILNDDSMKCWGSNYEGQLGNGSTLNSPTPQPVNLGQNAKSIALGQYHTCAILNDDSVKCWGNNSNGQLGIGSYSNASTPQPVNLTLP